MKRDPKAVGVGDGNWYSEAHDRRKWKEAWGQSLSEHQQAQEARRSDAGKNVVCGRCFRRESDKAVHRCRRPEDLEPTAQ